MTPGNYPIPAIVRGDTFRARDIATLSQDGVPLGLTSARMQVRNRNGGTVLLEWDTATGTAQITGAATNVVRLFEKTSAIMQAIPPGEHVYDLEVVFASDGSKLTILTGKFPVSADITRPA